MTTFSLNNLSARFGFGIHYCFCEESIPTTSPSDAGDFGYGGYEPNPSTTAVFIFMANYLTQKSPSHLELGAGLMYLTAPGAITNSKKNEHVIPTMTIGYRYQPWGGGAVFRLGATPVFRSEGMIVSVGVSIGGTL